MNDISIIRKITTIHYNHYIHNTWGEIDWIWWLHHWLIEEIKEGMIAFTAGSVIKSRNDEIP